MSVQHVENRSEQARRQRMYKIGRELLEEFLTVFEEEGTDIKDSAIFSVWRCNNECCVISHHERCVWYRDFNLFQHM